MESLAVVAVFAAVQVALIMFAEKYLTFGHFTNIALLAVAMVVVLLVGSGVIYCLVPFKGKTGSE